MTNRSNIDAGQILSCEYTVHPRWLNDNNDGNELWPANLPKQSSQDEMELVQDEVVIEEPEPIELNWTEDHEHEEISNCGDIIFEQDIPASLEEEVITNSGTEDTECDNNSEYNGSQSTQNTDYDYDSPKHLSDTYETIQHHYHQPEHDHHQRTTEQKRSRPIAKFKQRLMVSREILKLNQRKFTVDLGAGTSLLKPTIRDLSNDALRPPTEHITDQSDPNYINSILQTSEMGKMRHKKKSRSSSTKHSRHSGKSKSGKVSLIDTKASHKFVDLHGANITINHEADDSRSAERVVDIHGANITIQHEGLELRIKSIEQPAKLEQNVEKVRTLGMCPRNIKKLPTNSE